MTSPRAIWVFLISTALLHLTISENDWTGNCSNCTCIWASGRKSANCSNRGFNSIPTDLSHAIREVDFSNNNLYTLKDGEFIEAHLDDIHILKFQNCSIQVLNEGAFKRLALLIELDLSRNLIFDLKKDTFRENYKLRTLILSHNKIKVLVDGVFSNKSHMQRIHVDHNQIEYINEQTFYNLPALTDISLSDNKITVIGFDLKKKLPKLNSLTIDGNPWYCDCRLELFHRSVVINNLITQDTVCSAPPKMIGVHWHVKDMFPCSPNIIDPNSSTLLTATSHNITLTCKVLGEPEPHIIWNANGHPLDRDRKNKQKFFISKGRIGNFTYSNLTIINLTYKDRGDYKCFANNAGGDDEKNLTLLVDSEALAGGGLGGLGGSSALVIGLSVGLVLLLLIILILVCLFCRKSTNRALQSKRNEHGSSTEECMNMSGQLDMKKGLITEVNPIGKPPRSSVPGSVVSGGTEVSDAKRNLLDNEVGFDDDDSRSYDFGQPLLQKYHNQIVESDYHRLNHPTAYPPDLLPFPPRAQISPAGSNASTVVVDSRMPPVHGPQSPLQSPIYDQLSIYRTLPYSRSHSPFTAGVGVPRIPRQGYVTIPRKPRQSWSSEPPPSSEVIGEPIYDNLGIRSTADGSSVLSLNKAGSEPASTPRSVRLLPISPTTLAPIVDSHESPTSSVTVAQPTAMGEPQTPIVKKVKPVPPKKPITSQTLPRNLPSSKLPTSKWIDTSTPNDKRRSISSDTSTPLDEAKPKKIPPRPPPKPTNRVKSTGPLFEDEGEDGTEV